MKNLTITTSVALLLTALGSFAQQTEVLPKAFYKRCLVTSITGGPSRALFTTYNDDGVKQNSNLETGRIDPFIMEYGLTDKIGVGFSHGGENYDIDANAYYKANMPQDNKTMWASTKYLTADLSYHPYTTKRLDVSLFGSVGCFKVFGEIYQQNMDWCHPTDALYSYEGHGGIVRGGVRSRYYFSKRFGVMAMGYAFNGVAKEKRKPSPITDQPNNSGNWTILAGAGMEFGICFRIFKQKGVTHVAKKSLADKWNDLVENGWGQRKAEKQEEQESDKKPLFRLVWD
jgi:hypothetical protein